MQALVQGNAVKLATKIIHGNDIYTYLHNQLIVIFCLDGLSYMNRLG